MNARQGYIDSIDRTSDAADKAYLDALQTARWKATRDFNALEMSDCLCDKALLIAVLGEATDEEVGALVKKLVGERIEANAQFFAEVA